LQTEGCCLKNDNWRVSVCTLSVPPNSNIVQQNGTQSTFGIHLDVECKQCYRLIGSDASTTSIPCNENGIFDSTPACILKGKDTCLPYHILMQTAEENTDYLLNVSCRQYSISTLDRDAWLR